MSTPPRHNDETHPTSATSPLPETPAKKARVAKHMEYSPIPTRTRGQANTLKTILSCPNPQTPTNLEPKGHFLPPGPIVPYIKLKCLRALIKVKEKAGLTPPFVEMRAANMEVGDYGYVKYNVENVRGHACYLAKIFAVTEKHVRLQFADASLMGETVEDKQYWEDVELDKQIYAIIPNPIQETSAQMCRHMSAHRFARMHAVRTNSAKTQKPTRSRT